MNSRLYFVIFTVIFIFSSCGIGIPLEEMRKINYTKSFEIASGIIDEEIDELVFDMGIKIMNDYHSGILAYAKDQNEPYSYRTVFMAKAGVKLFDFEFNRDQMKVNSIIQQLDRSIILNLLERDLRMIFDLKVDDTQGVFQTKETGSVVLRAKEDKDLYHYYFNAKGEIYRIDKGSEYKSVVRLDARYDEKGLAERIFIQHKKIPFLMRLNRLASVN